MPQSFKIAVLGLDSVGKSSIINRIVQNQSDNQSDPTNEKCYESVNIDSKHTNISILDTSSQKDAAIFKSTPIENINCIIYVFALDDKATFEAAKNLYLNLNISRPKTSLLIIFCGNKSDVENRQITEFEALEFCDSNQILYFETSAKINSGIKDVFICAAEIMNKILPNIL